MPATTDINAIPYPENTDATNYPAAFDNLADSIDTLMVPRFASIAARTTAIPSPITGQLSFAPKATGSQVLQIQRNGAWHDLIWGAVVPKLTNETRTSTATPTASDELLFSAEANSTYIVEFKGTFSNAALATVNILFGLYAPAGSAASGVTMQTPPNTTTSVAAQVATAHATNLLTGNFGPGAFASSVIGSLVDAKFRLTTAGTAGTVGIRWAQGTVSANASTLHAGSWMRYTKVA